MTDGPSPDAGAQTRGRPLAFAICEDGGVLVGQAATVGLAMAMFRAALSEYPDRALVITRDGEVIFQRFA